MRLAMERGRWAWWLIASLAVAGCGTAETPAPVAQTTPTAEPSPAIAPAMPAEANPPPATAAAPAPAVNTRATAAWERFNHPGSPEEWEQAQQELIDLGADAAPVLVQALQSGFAPEREMAAGLLMQLGPDVPGVTKPLLAALSDESPFVRANAATALCFRPGHEDQVVPVLAALLASDDPHLRELAAMNLSNFGPEAAGSVPHLTQALERAPPDALRPIVELLGRIGPAAEPARPKLQQIAFEQEGDTREAATAALELIGSSQ